MSPTHPGTDALYLGGLCFITDCTACRLTCLEMTSLVLQSGCRLIQYREKHQYREKGRSEKHRSRREMYYEALRLRELTAEFKACLIINDYPDLAVAVHADGVHLGQDDMPAVAARKILGPDKIIGVSTHSVAEAVQAEQDGADYIGFGPVFHTTTKDAGKPQGPESLREIKAAVGIPIVAIGGIGVDNVSEVISSGANALAVASAILNGDIKENTKAFLRGLGEVS